MSNVQKRLSELGLVLPGPLKLPEGVTLPFPWVNVRGNRAIISGHGPTEADGSIARPLGKVGDQVSVQEAKELASKTALAILASLHRELGDLDRIVAWSKVFGMVNSPPNFNSQPEVINGFTDLIVSVFGPEVGQHARSAVGLAALPFDIAVEIEGEVTISE